MENSDIFGIIIIDGLTLTYHSEKTFKEKLDYYCLGEWYTIIESEYIGSIKIIILEKISK
jgi:hypothetical protein